MVYYLSFQPSAIESLVVFAPVTVLSVDLDRAGPRSFLMNSKKDAVVAEISYEYLRSILKGNMRTG